MAVSLRKPTKVDLSKPPVVTPIREITPEHLCEEYTPFSEKVITPEHIAKEVIPRNVEASANKSQIIICDEAEFGRIDDLSIHLPRWVSISITILGALVIVGLLFGVFAFLFTNLESVASAPGVSLDNSFLQAENFLFNLISDLFEWATASPLITWFLLCVPMFVGFRLIFHIFRNVD